jgi:hypothetical protein
LRPEIPKLEFALLVRLRQALVEQGWTVESDPATRVRSADLVARQGELRCFVELKAAHDARRSSLQAYLADAVLRARAAARRAGHGAVGLGVVAAPLITDAMAESLRQYAQKVDLGEGYGWADAAGRIEIYGEGLRVERGSHPRRRVGVQASRSQEIFTDLNQWLIKVLLAPRLSSDFLSGSRELPRTVGELARVAQVSLPSAHRLVRALEADGFLQPQTGLELTNVPALVQRWRLATRSGLREIGSRWIFPPADPQRELARRVAAHSEQLWPRHVVRETDGFLSKEQTWERGPRVCLALFSACDELGMGTVQGVPRAVYVERIDDALLKKLGLIPSRAGEPVDVVVRQPRFPEAVFRGAVFRQGVPVADVLQCWLDLVDHPSRGAEQADYLWSRIISRGIRAGMTNDEQGR